MSQNLTRRDVVLRSVPALAMAGALSMAGPLLGETTGGEKPAAPAAEGFKGGQYVLPPLPYDYKDLEPHIDEETMHLHHDKHHQAYVNNLNKAVKELAALDGPTAPAEATLTGLQEDLSFNAAGHVLHTLFWKVMAPSAGGEPHDELADALARDFGSVAAFRTRFAAVAAGVKGGGWAVLAYEPVARRLIVLQVKQHDFQLAPWIEPILVLDVWEHAYYLKYKNVRGKYVEAWWNVVNWPGVAEAYDNARNRYRG